MTLPLSDFYVSPGRRGGGYSSYCRSCSSAITSAYWHGRSVRHRLADVAAATDELTVDKRRKHWSMPNIPDLPDAPDWSRGICSRAGSQTRTWWTSSLPTEQKAAALACQSCEILAECSDFALAASEYATRGAVYAGLTPVQLRRERKARLDALAVAIRGQR